MGRNYGERGDDDAGCYDGTGGASGRYGSETPLDPLHRRGLTEQGERERLQTEYNPTDPAPVKPGDLLPDC
jgi:hypothetical protein